MQSILRSVRNVLGTRTTSFSPMAFRDNTPPCSRNSANSADSNGMGKDHDSRWTNVFIGGSTIAVGVILHQAYSGYKKKRAEEERAREQAKLLFDKFDKCRGRN